MSDAGLAITQARQLVTVKRYDEAITTLRPALADTATASMAFCLLSQCQLGLDRPKDAEVAAQQALAAGAVGEWPHRLIAISRLRRKQSRRAVAAAKEAMRQEPDNDQALAVHCLALIAARRSKQALPIAERNVATNPHSSPAFFTLGHAYADTGRRHDAETAYRTALRLNPENVEAALGLANLLRRMGRHKEAGQAFLTAATVDPTNHRARRGLSRLGLPLFATGVLAIFAGLQDALIVLHSVLSLGTIALLWFLAMGTGASLTTWLRVRGGRSLPAHVRTGLRADYRNAALTWGLVTGVGGILLGLIGLGAAHAPALGMVLLVLGATLIVAYWRLHIGPHIGMRRLSQRLRLPWRR